MIRRVNLGMAAMLGAAGAAPAGESSITYRVHFDNPGPYGNGELVSGSVWIDWRAPEQGQPGVARMQDSRHPGRVQPAEKPAPGR